MIPANKILGYFSPQGRGERFLRSWWWALLLAFAFLYYGQYYRAGLYPAAEGGMEGVVALRLIEGQRPIVDTFLGYNLLWFYPIVWVFKIVGPSYTALRLFFLALCTATGLIAFRIVLKATGRAWAAFLCGLLVLVIPGQMFRNYMAFIAVVNMSLFLSAYVLPTQGITRRLLWMGGCGVTLGLTYLIRIDVGVFLTVVLLGLILVFPLFPRSELALRKKILIAMAGAGLSLLGLFATHLPVYLDAQRGGFASEFLDQYRHWPDMIRVQGGRMMAIASETLAGVIPRKPTASGSIQTNQIPAASVVPSANPVAAPAAAKISHEALERRSLFTGDTRDRMLALNIYLPILAGILLGISGALSLLCSIYFRDEEVGRRALVMLTCLGCSLTLFPQYFFWRPDMVHLSEFMVPMTATLIVAALLIMDSRRVAGRFLRVWGALTIAVLSMTLVLYYINACQSQSSGGIATVQKKRIEFRGANGVSVKLTPAESKDATAIRDIIAAVSEPREFLICYPYNPEINFMTDRPSYEHNLYADNGLSGDQFSKDAVIKIEKHRPVAFVITDWEVNNTKESRFSTWASGTYGYIASNYVRAYRNGIVEVFVRPDRASRIPRL